jgi:tetratricopeptide (TPR) repeat protein
VLYNYPVNITPDNIHEKLIDIQTLREVQGKEEETLALIDQAIPIASQIKDFDLVAVLYWEYSIVWQHVVMSEIAKSEEDRDQVVLSEALEKMSKYAYDAHKVIEENKLTEKLPISYRFLGRVSDYNEDFETSIKHYEKALELLPPTSHSILEVNGFLSYSLVMKGETEKGVKLAKETFDNYFNSKLGKDLKKEDYFKWSVWMSGVAPRILFALDDTDSEYDSEDMKRWLEATKTELENPTGNITWGDDKFSFRIEELTVSLGKLAIIVLLPLILKIR